MTDDATPSGVDALPANRHTVKRSGTTLVFRPYRRKRVTVGVLGVAMSILLIGVGIAALIDPAAWQVRPGIPLVFIACGLGVAWLGICAFRMGVQIRAGKLIIGQEMSTQTVDAGDVRAITLEPKAINELGATHWIAQAELTNGRRLWIEGLDCGPSKKPPRPEMTAILDEVRALLGVTADDTDQQEMTCVECGAEMGTARTCRRCGAAVPEHPEDQAPVPAPALVEAAESPRGLGVLAWIGIVLLNLLALYFVIGSVVVGTEGSPAWGANYVPPWACAVIGFAGAMVPACTVVVVVRRRRRRLREHRAIASDSTELLPESLN